MAIHQSGVEFDVIFGPAYKGIPLATATAMAWWQLYGEAKDVCYNRKEVRVRIRCSPLDDVWSSG